MNRKVCIVTGTRAEYGLLYRLIKKIQSDDTLRLQLVATGMHLSPEFGLTVREIEKDGFPVSERLEMLLSSDTETAISTSMGLGMIEFAKAYEKLNPDLIIVLGDRFEIFAAVAASVPFRIPVAHLHGGEITRGAFDDVLRHCITKMSHIHFTSTEEYRERVIQLGEHPSRVFNVGAIGLDNIRHLNLLRNKELEKKLKFKFNKHNLLVTFHPVTLEKNTSKIQFSNLLHVLETLQETNVIFTKANADTNGRIINAMIDNYVLKNPYKAKAFTSMGQKLYLSTMHFVDAVVGNSSSGIFEAPSFKVGTINIGDRQQGRIKAHSVIDCEPTKNGIRDAFKMLYSNDFQKRLKIVRNPYGDGNTADKIITILKKTHLKSIVIKSFYDCTYNT